MRSRIIEFILKRKRLSDDVNDEFAFGIDKCLSDGIYTAAYPLHDVSQSSVSNCSSFPNAFQF